MATLALSLNGSTTTTKTISSAQLTRAQTAVTATLADRGISNPTTQQIVDYLMERFAADLITFVRNYEQQQADLGVSSISLT